MEEDSSRTMTASTRAATSSGTGIADAPFELALASSGLVGMLASFTVSATSTLAWIAATLVTTVTASLFTRKRF